MSGNEFARFAADLLRASTGIDKLGERAADEVGRGALDTAESIAPDDTGELKRKLSLRRRGSTSTIEGGTDHDWWQEYGTSDMAPNPFMGPTVDIWGPRLVRKVEGIADDVVRKLT